MIFRPRIRIFLSTAWVDQMAQAARARWPDFWQMNRTEITQSPFSRTVERENGKRSSRNAENDGQSTHQALQGG